MCLYETGCGPNVCSGPERVLQNGSFLVDSANMYADECNSDMTASELKGQVIQILDQQLPQTDLDGSPQVVSVQGDWRFLLGHVPLKCGIGWGI